MRPRSTNVPAASGGGSVNRWIGAVIPPSRRWIASAARATPSLVAPPCSIAPGRGRVPVAVGVALGDPHDLGPGCLLVENPDVVPDRGEIDLGPDGTPALGDLGLGEPAHGRTGVAAPPDARAERLRAVPGDDPFGSLKLTSYRSGHPMSVRTSHGRIFRAGPGRQASRYRRRRSGHPRAGGGQLGRPRG